MKPNYYENSVAEVEADTTMRSYISDIQVAISWREIARTYFNKSASWLYHKLDGIDGNGGHDSFSTEEALQLKGALVDLSERIRKVADSIPV